MAAAKKGLFGKPPCDLEKIPWNELDFNDPDLLKKFFEAAQKSGAIDQVR